MLNGAKVFPHFHNNTSLLGDESVICAWTWSSFTVKKRFRCNSKTLDTHFGFTWNSFVLFLLQPVERRNILQWHQWMRDINEITHLKSLANFHSSRKIDEGIGRNWLCLFSKQCLRKFLLNTVLQSLIAFIICFTHRLYFLCLWGSNVSFKEPDTGIFRRPRPTLLLLGAASCCLWRSSHRRVL